MLTLPICCVRAENFDRLGRNELFMASPDVLKFRFSQLHKTTPNIVRIINMSSEKQRIHVLDSTQPQFKFSFNGSKKVRRPAGPALVPCRCSPLLASSFVPFAR